MTKRHKLKLLIIVSSILSTQLLATNGYFSHGYGGKEKGMAGAGVAKGGNSITTANNPANLFQIGERVDIGLAIFDPVRSYSVSGEPSLPSGFSPVIGSPALNCTPPLAQATCQVPFSINTGTVDSGREWFAIPSFGYSTRIGDELMFGLALYGNGGMNTQYSGGSARFLDPDSNTIVNAPGTFGSGTTGVDLAQLFINNTLAYQANEKVTLGVSFIIAMQAFEATGLNAFANNSLEPTKLTNNGHDMSYGYGLKLGANFSLSDNFVIGLSYQTEMNMTEFDDYAGLFAQQGDFNIPSTYTVGFAWDTSDTSVLLLDYQTINYSDIPAIANSISLLLNPASCTDALNNFLISGSQAATGSGCLGGSQGAGFGWEDVSVIKLGYEWAIGDNTYRVGYSTLEQPINSNEVNFNLLAPGVVEDHFTIGYTNNSGENEWTIFLMYAPEVEVIGTSNFDPSQAISFKMHQFEFGLEYRL